MLQVLEKEGGFFLFAKSNWHGLIKGGWGRDIASPTCVEVWQPDALISPHITFPQKKKKYLKIVSQKIFCWQVYQGDVIVFELWQKHKVHKILIFLQFDWQFISQKLVKRSFKKDTYFFSKGSTLRGVFSLLYLLWTLEKFWQNQHM